MMKAWYKNLPVSFRNSTLIGVGLILFLVSQEYLSYLLGNYKYEFSWATIGGRNTISVCVILGLTPLINYFLNLFYGRKWRLKEIILSLLASLGIAILHQFLSTFLFNCFYQLFTEGRISSLSSLWLIKSGLAGIFTSLIYYWVIYLGYLAALNGKKIIKQEKELANSRLEALQSQLQPHFLFNTLNSISSLMDFDVPASQRMVNQLAHLLRSVLDKEKQAFIPLEEELNFIRTYLSIEEIRFSDRLKISYDISVETHQILVPTLILQPLVENAIKHGIAKKEDDGLIDIRAELLSAKPPFLRLEVFDNGPGMSEVGELNKGLGLMNVRRRLQEIYGFNYKMEIGQRENQGFKVEIQLPINRGNYEYQNDYR